MHTCTRRPLPRGLIRFDEVVMAIHLTLCFLVLYGFLLGLRFNWTVAILFALQVSRGGGNKSWRCVFKHLIYLQIAYTYLMYIEFGCGEILETTPIFYGLIHQVAWKWIALVLIHPPSVVHLLWRILHLCTRRSVLEQPLALLVGECGLLWVLHLRNFPQT